MAVKKIYKCKLCDLIYASKQTLMVHENGQHKNIKFTCQDCGKQFTQIGNLTVHINDIHERIKHKCSQCDKQFSGKSAVSMK